MSALPTPDPSVAEPMRVRLSTPADLAAAVPHLLGFVPRESLVLICLRRPDPASKPRIMLTLRLDLPPQGEDGEAGTADAVAAVVQLLRSAVDDVEAEQAVVFIVTEEAPPPGVLLPRTELADAIEAAFEPLVVDVLCRWSDQVASYLCTRPGCCPTTVTSTGPGALAVAAAHAVTGRAVLASREAVTALVEVPDEAVERPVLTAFARRWETGGRDDGADLRAFERALARRRDGTAGPLTHTQVARIAYGCRQLAVSGAALRIMTDEEELGHLVELLAEVSRRIGPPWDADVCGLLAVAAYLDGSGVLAGAAAERVRVSRPDGVFAGLVRAWQESLTRPGEARDLLRRLLDRP